MTQLIVGSGESSYRKGEIIPGPEETMNDPVLRRVYWETTAACNLRCIHCRRIDVLDRLSPEELTTPESCAMIDDIASMGKSVLILSGGEPLYRKDIFEIASHARGRGLPVALSTNGTMVSEPLARKIAESGIYYASISLDGARPETHDLFRGAGNYARAVAGMVRMREAGIKVQINFTLTRQNAAELPEMLELATSLKAHALYLFLLVPVGCGVQIADSQMLSPEEVESWLVWVREQSKTASIELRPICAPQYYRVIGHRKPQRLGCLAGINICFVSHKGDVYPCGYLPVSAGNVRSERLSDLWKVSSTFSHLRNENLLDGKCGVCEFKSGCGGCRARAYYKEGSYLAEEPYCVYEPAASAAGLAH